MKKTELVLKCSHVNDGLTNTLRTNWIIDSRFLLYCFGHLSRVGRPALLYDTKGNWRIIIYVLGFRNTFRTPFLEIFRYNASVSKWIIDVTLYVENII